MALDTLGNVKTRLGITGTAYDSFLTAQIALISDIIENYLGRKLMTANYKQTFYRDEIPAAKKAELFHYPVTAVASVIEDGNTLDSSFYRLHGDSGQLLAIEGHTFFCAKKTEITFTAGYATCPSAILAVLDDIVNERYNKRVAGVALDFGDDVQRVSIPGAISIDFDYSLSNNERKSAYGVILGSNVNILDHWRSERAVLGKEKREYVVTL